jgi:hypothetical protein
MPWSRLIPLSTCLASSFLLVHCSNTPPDSDGTSGTSGSSGSGGSATGGTGGSTMSSGGKSATGGTVSSGGMAATGGAVSSGGMPATGGAVSSGGMAATGGAVSSGGMATGGAVSSGGMTATGGVVSSGGAPATGGMPGMGGSPSMGGSGPDLDQNGKPNAAPGAMTSTARDYLRLGDVRILNNNWGSAELGCTAPMSVFVNMDRTFGWNFNRGDCDMAATNAKPDFPQVEFGIHPFGIGDARATSPNFSSTTLLPIQLKSVTSATINIQNMAATFQQETSWNITFEFWISERHPVTDPSPGVYAEIMTFWGWQNGKWPSSPMGNGSGSKISSGGKSYTLWVQDDAWANGQWRYYQYRADDGPQKSFNGTLDVKPFIDYLISSRSYSPDFWITRLEVGSEIDDMTAGTVKFSGITFEVNGQSRMAVIGSN